jgi:hypothetical protein
VTCGFGANQVTVYSLAQVGILRGRFGYCIDLPDLKGFPVDSQRGAIAQAIDAKTLWRFACPKPESFNR